MIQRRSLSHRRRVAASPFVPSDVPQAEADSLILLYDNTAGDDWIDNTGWKTDPVVNNWFGVTVEGGHVTRINLSSNNLAGDLGSWTPLESLTYLELQKTSLSGDISGWTLPASLIRLYLHETSVSGDISGWTFPASLTRLFINETSLSGDISGWTFPASLGSLYINDTSLSGDISGWTFPAGMIKLYLYNTSVSGDISGWTLNASLDALYLYGTSVNGDISGWTLPATLSNLRLYGLSVSGDISGWTIPAAMSRLYIHDTSLSGAPSMTSAAAIILMNFENCGLSQADVDQNLLNIYNRRMSFTNAAPELQIGESNAAPGGVYQAQCPPTTGNEYRYELVNDSCGDGFNTWTVEV